VFADTKRKYIRMGKKSSQRILAWNTACASIVSFTVMRLIEQKNRKKKQMKNALKLKTITNAVPDTNAKKMKG